MGITLRPCYVALFSISGPNWSIRTTVFACPLSSRLASGAIQYGLPCPGLLCFHIGYPHSFHTTV